MSSLRYNIICGTYEHVLYGYIGQYDSNGFQLSLNFVTQSHLGSIRALDAQGKWLISTSSDETIKSYDLSKSKEIATMTFHDDVIDSVSLFQNNFITSGKDGKICIWKLKDWECLKTLRGHTLGVNSFSIHPSGKIGLSCGVDRTLRVWNLINGRAAHDSTLNYNPEKVLWSPDGDFYCIVSFHNVFYYNMEGEKLNTFVGNNYKQILDVVFLDNETIAFGGEDKQITIAKVTGEILFNIEGFGNRIKALKCIPKPQDAINQYSNLLISISSDGSIKVFDLDISTNPIAEELIQNRLICLTASVIDYE